MNKSRPGDDAQLRRSKAAKLGWARRKKAREDAARAKDPLGAAMCDFYKTHLSPAYVSHLVVPEQDNA